MAKKKRRRKKQKKFYIRKILALLLVPVMTLICIAGGYEYYTTGRIDRTWGFLEEVSGYVQELPGYVQELPQQVQETERLVRRQWNRWMGGGSGGQLDSIPEYQGLSYVEVYDNIPSFTEAERNSDPYEFYSDLDALGRCGYAEAKITRDLMPTEERGRIGMVKPSGWHTVKYKEIDGNYLYNRCHLLGYQLTGENANEKNLITGTRYLNVTGMLPWENMVADYVRETGDAVMYRVTPIYDGENLLASGVQMEAESLESEEIEFNIFVFNVQPGIGIDYSNGDSWRE